MFLRHLSTDDTGCYEQAEPDESTLEQLNAVGAQIVSASELLLESLKRIPEMIDTITPRQFEEVVAELLDDPGTVRDAVRRQCVLRYDGDHFDILKRSLCVSQQA